MSFDLGLSGCRALAERLAAEAGTDYEADRGQPRNGIRNWLIQVASSKARNRSDAR